MNNSDQLNGSILRNRRTLCRRKSNTSNSGWIKRNWNGSEQEKLVALPQHHISQNGSSRDIYPTPDILAPLLRWDFRGIALLQMKRNDQKVRAPTCTVPIITERKIATETSRRGGGGGTRKGKRRLTNYKKWARRPVIIIVMVRFQKGITQVGKVQRHTQPVSYFVRRIPSHLVVADIETTVVELECRKKRNSLPCFRPLRVKAFGRTSFF